MITSSLSKMRKSGDTINMHNFLIFIAHYQVFVRRERLP